MTIKKSTIYNIFEYLLVVALILHCRTIWSYSTGIRNYFTYINIVLLVIGAVGCVLFSPIIRIKDTVNAIFLWIVISIFLFIIFLITGYNADGLFRLDVAIFSIILFIAGCINSNEDIIRVFTKLHRIILIIILISLIFWVAGSQLSIIEPNLQMYSEWNERNVKGYYYIYFEPQTAYSLFTGKVLIRNCAFFTEAPMCSFVFCIGLIGYEYILRGKSWIIRTIYCIAILTTVCTTGYIILLLVLCLKIIIFKPNTKTKVMLKFMALFVVFIALVAVWIIFFNKLETASGGTRMDDFIAGFLSWKDNMFFGNGLENLEHIQKYMSGFRSNNRGFSNSIMQLLSDGGICFGAFYFISAFRGIKASLSQKDYSALAFEALFLVMFFITIVTYTNMAIFIVLMLLNRKIQSNRNYGETQ